METLTPAGGDTPTEVAIAEGLGIALLALDVTGELRALSSAGRALLRLECEQATTTLAGLLARLPAVGRTELEGGYVWNGSAQGLVCLYDLQIGRRYFEVRSCPAPHPARKGRRLFALFERTDYLSATEALADSESRFAEFTAHLPGLAWIKDAAGRLIWANRSFQAGFAGRRSAWIYRSDNEIWGDDLGPQIRRGDLAVMESGQPSLVDEVLLLAGQRRRWRLSRFLIRASDGSRHLACIAHSLESETDAVAAAAELALPRPGMDAALQAQRTLPDLSQALIWQLEQGMQTAVTAVRGLRQAAEAAPDTAGRTTCLRGLEALELAPRLLQGLEACIGGRPLPIQAEWVELSQLGSELIPEVAQRHARTRPRFSIEPGVQAWADRALLKLVLIQLLENACKFAALVGSPLVSIEGLPGAPRQGFRVRDNGPGFEPRQSAGIFHAFGRLPEVMDVPGLGLGLALVAGIVAGHGGRVWADGRPGEGAVFAVSLPLPDASSR